MSDIICYSCGNPITEENGALEHIIPNALGGRLKSRRLLHRSCNSNFGDTIDASLVDALNIFMVLFNISRDDGETPPSFRTTTTDGESVYVDADGGVRLTKPEPPKMERLSDDKIDVKLVAPNMKIVRKQLTGLARKYPTLNIPEMLAKSKPTLEWGPIINFRLCLDKPEHERAITKIALGYYLHSGGMINSVKPAIEYVKSNSNGPFIFSLCGHPIIDTQPGDIVHHIEVLTNQHGIHAYAQLFSALRLYVRLSTEPQSDRLHKKYTFDCLNSSPITRESSFASLVESGVDMRNIGYDNDGLQKEICRISSLYSKKNQNSAIERFVSQAVDAVFEKFRAMDYEPTAIEFANATWAAMEATVMEWVRNACDARRKAEGEVKYEV